MARQQLLVKSSGHVARINLQAIGERINKIKTESAFALGKQKVSKHSQLKAGNQQSICIKITGIKKGVVPFGKMPRLERE